MIKVVGQFQGEKMHEKLFIEGEDVVTDMDYTTSDRGEKISIDEIKVWLDRHTANTYA